MVQTPHTSTAAILQQCNDSTTILFYFSHCIMGHYFHHFMHKIGLRNLTLDVFRIGARDFYL